MMSRLIVRKLGLLTIAAALLTGTTVAFAAAPADSPSFSQTEKKQTTTLDELSPRLQRSAVQAARSRPNGTKLTAPGEAPQTTGVSDAELDLMCGDWFVMWEEDADGDPILGTFTLDCGGTEIPLP